METQFPTVIGEFGEVPELVFPEGVPGPKGLRVKILQEGTGEVVHAGDEVEVDYHGQIWDGPIFDSSYYRDDDSVFPIGVHMVIQGWDDAIVGQKVGTRLLISVPPFKGYGPSGNPRAGIKGDDVLVFVVDIKGIGKPAFNFSSMHDF